MELELISRKIFMIASAVVWYSVLLLETLGWFCIIQLVIQEISKIA